MRVRSFLALLTELDGGRYLDGSARALTEMDMSLFAHVSLRNETDAVSDDPRQALAPETVMGDTVPPVLPEILLLAEDCKLDAPSILVNSLWYRYRTSSDWGWKVWDNADDR